MRANKRKVVLPVSQSSTYQCPDYTTPFRDCAAKCIIEHGIVIGVSFRQTRHLQTIYSRNDTGLRTAALLLGSTSTLLRFTKQHQAQQQASVASPPRGLINPYPSSCECTRRDCRITSGRCGSPHGDGQYVGPNQLHQEGRSPC